MKYIDLHCDTAYRMIKENLSLNDDACKVNIEKLKKGGALAQTFAFFVDLEEEKDPYDAFTSMYNNFIKEVGKNKDKIEIVRNRDELKQCNNNGKVGAFLSIEEGEVLKGDVSKVLDVYEKGIRMLTLTWNYENSIGYPNVNFKYKDKGLKEKGVEIVNEMERVGIIPDCSHLSDGGFYDLSKICKKPFIATHSNARAIKNHPRNLTDDMIKILSNKGGVMGLNFCSDFVAEDEVTKVLKIAKHAKHIKNVGGIDVLSIGSDFDGIENEVEIKDTSEMDKLYYGLKKEGFTDDDIEKVFYKNIIRVLKEWSM
ncbi:peptidase M19 [Clostridium baratii]|uniref:dipeptidase n=1 Tax=Clostridium baratii TaxID=1561 RepID=UPI0009A2CF3A|nr:dipeptidase [Clostridium baratii]OPF51849.1 peptidase M19 [Clostridium baratii]OPF53495.1 peptidase M19 [Clostridium baratii]OPF57360.1 peptidase M19 [Clostridium baratii]OPF60542.1 peptidase M19 [Clostridium baratii]